MTSPSLPFLSRGAGAALLITASALLVACGGQGGSFQMPPAPVGVAVAQAQAVPLLRSATGRLSAFRSADVRARVSGVLLKRTYDEGTHVDKGQQLFEIDPAPLKATLSAALASLAQAKATYANAQVAAKRARKLAPKGYVSQADLDNADAAERTAKAAVQAAQAQVQSARINLGYASVQAPISGRAGKQQVTEGALVGQGSATLLTTVRQINPLYINFSMPVSEIQQLRADQARGTATLAGETSVQITLADGSPYAHQGTLDFSGMAVDPSTGTVTLRAKVPNPKEVLLPGMYAQLTVDLGTLNKAYIIPQNAVLRDGNSAYVLVVGKDNKVVRKNVHTTEMRGADWIITQGISPGDRVIVSGIAKARIGAEVKPHVEAANAASSTTTAAPAQAAPASSSSSPQAATNQA